MSMSVGKISNLYFTGTGSRSGYDRGGCDNGGLNRGRIQERDNQSNYGNNGSNDSLRNAAKVLMGLYLMGVAAGTTSTLSGCAKAEAYAEANDSILKALLDKKDSCGCCPTQVIHNTDTLWLHDTVPQIINHTDTLRIKPNFRSPVIDTLNMILHDLGNDTTGGYIPLTVSFIDEMDTKYKDHVFDGEASAPSNVFYNAKHSPWSDREFKFIIGTPLDESLKYMLSLTGDGKLFVQQMVPKLGVTNPQGLEDYMFGANGFVFDRDQANKLIRKFNVARDQVGREYAGTLEKTALPKTIMVTNPENTNWRWTNVNIGRGDAPAKVEE